MKDISENLKELEIEDFIWIISLFSACFALLSNKLEKDYLYTHNLSKEKEYKTKNQTSQIIDKTLEKEQIFNGSIQFLQEFRIEVNRKQTKEEIAKHIIEKIPDVMMLCSKILKISNYPWNKDDIVYNRIEKLIVS